MDDMTSYRNDMGNEPNGNEAPNGNDGGNSYEAANGYEGANGFVGHLGSGDRSTIAPDGDQSNDTLWIGRLDAKWDEEYVKQFFKLNCPNEVVEVKIKRTKTPCFGFVKFHNNDEAKNAMLAINGKQIKTLPPDDKIGFPGGQTDQSFLINWAHGSGTQQDRREDRVPEYSIFVGDLAHDVNELSLVALFQARFRSCRTAKIMTDQQTGQSRGYGFVRFADEQEQQRALVEMQGAYCSNRPMRVLPATPKNRNGLPEQQRNMGVFNPYGGGNGGGHFPPHTYMGPSHGHPPQPHLQQQQSIVTLNQFTDPNNTTVFVGGLSGYVTEDELRSFFQGFGEITYVKIPPGKGCGFVQFVHRHAAEMAINQMQGYPIGNSRVRLSWGRSQNNSGIGTPYLGNQGPSGGLQTGNQFAEFPGGQHMPRAQPQHINPLGTNGHDSGFDSNSGQMPGGSYSMMPPYSYRPRNID